MLAYLLVALGGALGSVARFAMALAVEARFGLGFPWGTLAINVIGSFAIGVLAGLVGSKTLQQFLMVGVLGGYTTFSSFSLQTVRLAEDGRWGAAAGYVAASVALALAGTLLGLFLARVLAARGMEP